MKVKELKNIFFEILSFGSPRAIVFNLSMILFILAIAPFGILPYSPFKCVFRHLLLPLLFKVCPTSGLFADCQCPACGLTRGMQRLMHGDIEGAIGYNMLVIPLFIAMIIMIGINIYKIVKIKKN